MKKSTKRIISTILLLTLISVTFLVGCADDKNADNEEDSVYCTK